MRQITKVKNTVQTYIKNIKNKCECAKRVSSICDPGKINLRMMAWVKMKKNLHFTFWLINDVSTLSGIHLHGNATEKIVLTIVK